MSWFCNISSQTIFFGFKSCLDWSIYPNSTPFAIWTIPDVGFNWPTINLNNVVFPIPFGPTIPTTIPGLNENVNFLKNVLPLSSWIYVKSSTFNINGPCNTFPCGINNVGSYPIKGITSLVSNCFSNSLILLILPLTFCPFVNIWCSLSIVFFNFSCILSSVNAIFDLFFNHSVYNP